jgi:hypothetical protein
MESGVCHYVGVAHKRSHRNRIGIAFIFFLLSVQAYMKQTNTALRVGG